MSEANQTQSGSNLDSLAPRGAAGGAALHGRPGYYALVGVLKVVLPVAAVAMFLLVVFWPQLQTEIGGVKVKVSDVSLSQTGTMTLFDPHFEGVDSSGQPYNLTAEQASRSSGNSDVVILDLPKGDITLDSGTWLALDARTGRYDQLAQTLDLYGDVTLFHDRGFEIKTESARIDLAAGTARGREAVAGQGPEGELKAQGFQVLDKGERIIFTGRSRVLIYPQVDRGGT
ncbi:MAG: LPS export ABC transporter periplasmic protein LptC [Kiloniellales bacterium]|nr:LPS export ABC transporter periplasmic protein LptC [Kiloniellales bacterium]